MSDEPTPAGPDLARRALAQYMASAKNQPSQPRQSAKPRRTVRAGVRRDPVAFGDALTRLAGELGWQSGVDGGNIIDRWAELCPQYVDRIEPVHYDPERRVLELRPCSPAYAAQLRLLGGQLAKQINDKVGAEVVRAIKPLPVGAVASAPSSRPDTAAAPVASVAPVKTRDTASDGYRAALAAIQKKPDTGLDGLVAAAIEGQTRDAAREPEHVHTNAIAALEALNAGQELTRAEEVRQAAIRHKHGGDQAVRTAFDVA
ncbi:DciA family protein [Streptomyces sp. NPDC087866]|uniref:DciA family protein n=1 Tax=Streptomyces sp. NPDC087866 TaxID=3365815 RepID=UPI0038163CB9